ncbi:NAD(P)H-hydrate dehydratase [Peptococcaceae bacterium]|nr:NAD(P)H-hydrate dehydratase [Peptococcaceae bacterium]
MRKIDRITIDEYGIPGVVLMENAGRKVAEIVCTELGGCVCGKVIAVFVGKGNNGGDGLVAARHLLNRGADVRIFLLANPDEIKGDAAINFAIFKKMSKNIYHVYQQNGVNIVKVSLLNTDLIIDAIYGTGFRGKVNEKVSRIIQLINDSNVPVVSVDIPSGLEADTGRLSNICVKADTTVTFGLPKLGLVIEKGLDVVGKLKVVDISIPKALLNSVDLNKHILDSDMIRSWIPKRKLDAHKGNFGRVLIVAGSKGMTGAALLTAKACLRAGAGLVTLAVPEQIHSIVSAKAPEIMTYPLLGTEEGTVSEGALQEILDKVDNDKIDVLAVGPGLSLNDETITLVTGLLKKIKIPLILDADGLNALAENPEILKDSTAPIVITPHPGEMARLLGASTAEVQQKRLDITMRYAKEWGVTLLLKGARTLIASPDGMLYINSTGNPGMATAGSGDVLAGIITGFVAQGLSMHHAAAAGAYLHGMAGDKGSAELGQNALMAGDVLNYLPVCMKEVLGY